MKKPKQQITEQPDILAGAFYSVTIPENTDVKKLQQFKELARDLGVVFEVATAPEQPLSPGTQAGAPRWSNKPEDCKLTSREWIIKYYSHLIGEVDADQGERNRRQLAAKDPELARAYSSSIRSNPKIALPGLPLLPRNAADNSEVALERRKRQAREASARYRAKHI